MCLVSRNDLFARYHCHRTLVGFPQEPDDLLFRESLLHVQLPGRSLEAVEYATLEWVDWFNNRRLLEPIGDVPPAEFEQAYYQQQESVALAA